MDHERLAVDASTSVEDSVALTEAWVEAHVPVAWRDAAARGGNTAIREVRGRADYEAWYPVFGASGLVMPTWAPEYGGLGVAPETAGAMRTVLAPYNLRALNPLGLNNTAAALFAHGTEEQKRASWGRSCATRRSGASSSASRAPGPTSRRSRRGRCSTATSGS